MNLPGSHPYGWLTALPAMRRWRQGFKFAPTGARQGIFCSKDHANWLRLLPPYQPQCKQVGSELCGIQGGDSLQLACNFGLMETCTSSSGKPDLFLNNWRIWFGSFISGSRLLFKALVYPGRISCLTLVSMLNVVDSASRMKCAASTFDLHQVFDVSFCGGEMYWTWNDSAVYHGSNKGQWLSAGFPLQITFRPLHDQAGWTAKGYIVCTVPFMSHASLAAMFFTMTGLLFRSNINHDWPWLLFPIMLGSMHDHCSKNVPIMTDEPPDH